MYLPSEDILCGQLEDESLKERYNRTGQERKRKKERTSTTEISCIAEMQFCEWMKKTFMCSSCQLSFGARVQERHAALISACLEATLSWLVFMLRRVEISYMCGTFVD